MTRGDEGSSPNYDDDFADQLNVFKEVDTAKASCGGHCVAEVPDDHGDSDNIGSDTAVTTYDAVGDEGVTTYEDEGNLSAGDDFNECQEIDTEPNCDGHDVAGPADHADSDRTFSDDAVITIDAGSSSSASHFGGPPHDKDHFITRSGMQVEVKDHFIARSGMQVAVMDTSSYEFVLCRHSVARLLRLEVDDLHDAQVLLAHYRLLCRNIDFDTDDLKKLLLTRHGIIYRPHGDGNDEDDEDSDEEEDDIGKIVPSPSSASPPRPEAAATPAGLE